MNTGDVIINKYMLQEEIGRGKFGVVYKGIYIKNDSTIAIKTETARTPYKILKHEVSILTYLYEHGCRQIPAVYWYGVFNTFTCLVMTYYPCSLTQYLRTLPIPLMYAQSCPQSFPNEDEIAKYSVDFLKKINRIMSACIQVIESIHKLFIIHRDIKPDNFMIDSATLYMIDFGLATFYIDEHKEHRLESSHDMILGTPKYASYHIHCGHSPSRRDDMISLGYVYIYLFCRELSWDNLPPPPKNENIDTTYDDMHILNYKNIQRKNLKSWDSLEPICKKINDKLHDYMEYCYQLGYSDLPNYAALTELFLQE